MSGDGPRRCVTCGAERVKFEMNHVAARANDRALVTPNCVRCHNTFTDFQWALGILRRESVVDRMNHSAEERLWALLDGLAILALMGGPEAHRDWWVSLARAAGTWLQVATEADGREAQWGPRPAKARADRPPLPPRRGSGGGLAMLEVALQGGDTHLPDDPAWPDVRDGARALAAGREAIPALLEVVAERLRVALDHLASTTGVADLDARRGEREAIVREIRDVLGSPRTQSDDESQR